MISLQNTYKEVNSNRELLFVQIEKYVGGHETEKQIVNELLEESDDEELVHKTPTQTQNHQDSYQKIRPDQLWAFLISKTTTNWDEVTKLVSYVYSIPCSNAFAEGVFSHMKHLWTNSRSSMLRETVAAELKIRLNCKIKCNVFFTFVPNELELIKCARRQDKYSHINKPCSN